MRHSERGNAVLFVLIAVALFGALAYTFMRGAKSGQGNLTGHQANLGATEILSYTQRLERTVDKLRQNGCSESELAYYDAGNPKLAGFEHVPADRDECNLLSPQGGNLEIPDFLETGKLDTTIGWTNFVGGELVYVVVDGVGKTNGDDASKDLVFWVRGVKREICVELNKKLGINPDITLAYWISVFPANGKFDQPAGVLNASFTGKTAGCYFYGGGEYDFYYVVLAR